MFVLIFIDIVSPSEVSQVMSPSSVKICVSRAMRHRGVFSMRSFRAHPLRKSLESLVAPAY